MTSSREQVDQLYRRFAPRVHRALARQVGDDLAEDLTQDVFERALHGCGSFASTRKAWSWLFILVQRTLIDARTRHKQPVTVPLESVSAADLARLFPSGDPAEPPTDPIEAMLALTPRERTAIILRMRGYDRHEIASAQGIGTRGADTLLTRARNAMRAAILAQINETDRQAITRVDRTRTTFSTGGATNETARRPGAVA